jgi:branched-chain amino acid transport system permease protein
LIGRLVRCLAAAALVVMAPDGLASAQEGSAESVRGFVRNETEEDGEAVRTGVEGVTITVVDASGTEVGSATTDADGAFEVPVPEPGDYTVLLDTDTLPDDVELRDEADAERLVNVRPNERQVVNYNLGESGR